MDARADPRPRRRKESVADPQDWRRCKTNFKQARKSISKDRPHDETSRGCARRRMAIKSSGRPKSDNAIQGAHQTSDDQARHSERSRGILWKETEGSATGSFDFAALRSG